MTPLAQMKKLAKRNGLTVAEFDNGHVQVRGGAVTVNWYPLSKARTAYCNGAVAGLANASPEQVIALAMGKADPTRARVDRKRTYRRHKRRMWARDPRCHWCQKYLALDESTVDHKIPLSRGGANTGDNLVLACEPCNHGRGNDLPPVIQRSS